MSIWTAPTALEHQFKAIKILGSRLTLGYWPKFMKNDTWVWD